MRAQTVTVALPMKTLRIFVVERKKITKEITKRLTGTLSKYKLKKP